MQTCPFSHVRLGRSVVTQVQALLVVAIGLHHQQRNNFRDEQQQNAEWSGFSGDMCYFTVLPFGGPGRGGHYMPSEVTGQCPLCGLRLMTCHILNSILAFRRAGGKSRDGWRL